MSKRVVSAPALLLYQLSLWFGRRAISIICVTYANLTCMYSQQENKTQFTISMSLCPQTHKDKLATLMISTTSAIMVIAKSS